MIRVLVADDHEVVRAGIAALIAEQDIAVIAEAVDGQDALSQARAHRPDVILMDVQMPGTDGVTATRAIIDGGLIAQSGQPIAVIMLTTFDNDEAVHAAMRAGATGFLLKTAHRADIVNAIRAVIAGRAWVDPTVAGRIFIERPLSPDRPTATALDPDKAVNQEIAKLTAREREAVILLSQGLSDDEIAAKMFISANTAKTHIAHALPKVGAHNRTLLAIWAYQTGLVQPLLPDSRQ